MLRFVNLVLRDSPCESPFVPKSKCMPLNLLGSMITAGTQMSANYDTNKVNREIAEKNMQLQRETNAQNKQIADEANALNYKMFQEQNEWNLEQWNRQNQYNSPEHMVELYKKAGLNPAMLAGTFNQATPLSSAQAKDAVTSYNTAPQLDYHPITTDFTALGNNFQAAVNAYFQNRLLDSQRKKTELESSGQGILNERNIRFMPVELKRLTNEAKKEGVLGDIARSELDFQKKSFQTRLDMLYGDASIQQKSMKLMDEQLTTQQLDNEMKRIMNAYQPQWNDVQLKQANVALQTARAQIGLILANTTLTYNQAATEIEKKIGQTIDNQLNKVELGTRKELKKTIISSALEDLKQKKSQSYILGKEAQNWVSGERLRRLSSVIPFAGGSVKPSILK